ncbi:MAG: hypothetical protein ACLFNZ_10310 [Spirochaetaceae bacterium]
MKKIIIKLIVLISAAAHFSSCAGELKEDKTSYPMPLVQRQLPGGTHLPAGTLGNYSDYVGMGPLVPGILEGAVPQGMAYWAEEETMIISNYMYNDRPGVLTLVSMKEMEQNKTIWLNDNDGMPHKGHLGGLAVLGENLWVASGNHFYSLPLDLVSETEDNGILTLPPPLRSEVTGSFASNLGEYLMIGEFRNSNRQFQKPASHTYKTSGGGFNYALMAAFKTEADTGVLLSDRTPGGDVKPEFFLSIPDEVQGAAFLGNRIILSQSYGRRRPSRLSVYTSPLSGKQAGEPEGKPDDTFTLEDGSEVPVYFLDYSNLEKVSTLPPMSEGIVDYYGSVAVLFESGSVKFRRGAYLPQDRIHLLDPEFLDIYR